MPVKQRITYSKFNIISFGKMRFQGKVSRYAIRQTVAPANAAIYAPIAFVIGVWIHTRLKQERELAKP